MYSILVVDNNKDSLKQIVQYLSGTYNFSLAKSGQQALNICNQEIPNLILMDLETSDMDGFELMAQIKDNPALTRIPIILLSDRRDIETEALALKSGARDFIKKPVVQSILLHRINLHLKIYAYQSQLAESVSEISDNLGSSIADLIEWRDENTGGHVYRTAIYVNMLSLELLKNSQFKDKLSENSIKMITRSAPLHDIGKISITDSILLKPGKLDFDEFSIMKTHSEIGADILQKMYSRTPTLGYLKYATIIALSHHERYDGKGYPKGLKGEEIPLCARIMAVADVYDALVDNRIYRKGMSHQEAYNIIMEGCGTQFDPVVTEIFNQCHTQFIAVAAEQQQLHKANNL